jgi:hypothetical protein
MTEERPRMKGKMRVFNNTRHSPRERLGEDENPLASGLDPSTIIQDRT